MKLRTFALALALVTFTVVPGFVQEVQEKGGEDETGPYNVVPNWLKPLATHDAEWGWGNVPGVFAESPNRVFVLTRGDLPIKTQPGAKPVPPRRQNFIVVVNRDGQMVENWRQWDSMMRQPHVIRQSPFDPERRIWIVDSGRHQVMAFSNDGKQLLMTLGEADKPGTDQTHFGQPLDMAFFPDGTFLVADGLDNRRVVKFSKDGKYLMEWGTEGKNPGQFEFSVHGVAVDSQGRVLVCDRGNGRIQVFDANGKPLDQWPNFREPSRVFVASDGSVWVIDATTAKVLQYDRNGYFKSSWGTGGTFEGALQNPHLLSVDQEGTLYIADYGNKKAQKFTPKKNADKNKLVARQFGFSKS